LIFSLLSAKVPDDDFLIVGAGVVGIGGDAVGAVEVFVVLLDLLQLVTPQL
jgi:hypothetical protein